MFSLLGIIFSLICICICLPRLNFLSINRFERKKNIDLAISAFAMLHTLEGDVFRNYNLDEASLIIAGKSQIFVTSTLFLTDMRYWDILYIVFFFLVNDCRITCLWSLFFHHHLNYAEKALCASIKTNFVVVTNYVIPCLAMMSGHWVSLYPPVLQLDSFFNLRDGGLPFSFCN